MHQGEYNNLVQPDQPEDMRGRDISFKDVERMLQNVDKEIKDEYIEEQENIISGRSAHAWKPFNLGFDDLIRYVHDPADTVIAEYDDIPEHELLERIENHPNFEHKHKSNLGWQVYEGNLERYESNAKMLTAVKGNEAIHIYSREDTGLYRENIEDRAMRDALSAAMSTKEGDRASYAEQDDVMDYIIRQIRETHVSQFERRDKEDTEVDNPDWKTHGKELEGRVGNISTVKYNGDSKETQSYAVTENNGEIDKEYVTKREQDLRELLD